MIVFHEGLPGSGKSYEAIIEHLLESLKQGRRVVTNIDGINTEYISKYIGIPKSFLDQNIVSIYDEDVEVQKELLLEHITTDHICIIDEIQNLFPSVRDKLPSVWNVIISEHRHKGLDFVLLGQDRKDCHVMWRRRIQRVVTFNKLSAMGAENSYHWEVFEATRPEKFKLVTKGTKKYNPEIFPCYSSHTQGVNNKSNYTDKRALIWNNKGIKYGIPAALLVAYFAFSHILSFFDMDKVDNATVVEQDPEIIKSANADPIVSESVAVVPEPITVIAPFNPIDSFDSVAKSNGLRISMHYKSKSEDIYIIDVYHQSTHHLVDQYRIDDLMEMGWSYKIINNGSIVLRKEDRMYLARLKALDSPYGSTSNSNLAELAY